jgi:hypothetical protein
MAGIDIYGLFPNSKMAGAAKAGLSRFTSSESMSIPATFNPAAAPGNPAPPALVTSAGLKTGSFPISVTGTTSMAQMMTAAALSTSFQWLTLTATTASANGVTVTQGGVPVVLKQGQSVTFQNVATGTNPVSTTTGAGDLITGTFAGT